MTDHSIIAKDLFCQGYNCAQASFVAFCDVTCLDKETALMLSSSFGGGMGRLREVCGALTGVFMAAGLLFGYACDDCDEKKEAHYKLVQDIGLEFKEEFGSLLCRDLLGLSLEHDKPKPEKRTQKYYDTRPCASCVEGAARILDKYIKERE